MTTDTTDAPVMGGNAEADLKRRIDRRMTLLDEIGERQTKLKEYRVEDASEGFDDKALTKTVDLLRGDPKKVVATWTLTEIIKTYCRAAGVPADVKEAQEAAAAAAESIPDVEKKRQRRARVDLGDEHEED